MLVTEGFQPGELEAQQADDSPDPSRDDQEVGTTSRFDREWIDASRSRPLRELAATGVTPA